jgi:7-cyano-7-deazaguanine synthase
MNKKAVVLVSGGIDSATCLALAKHQGFEPCALSFDYGQKHRAELAAAKKAAKFLGIKTHKVMKLLSLGELGGSALTDNSIDVPNYVGSGAIPITYVPARNTVFLSIALAWAEVLGANDLFIGASAVDYSGYPDCRLEFIKAFQKMANLATKTAIEGNRVKIHTPLIALSKAETILLGTSLGVDYGQTVSCYQADENGRACGKCDSCYLRRKGFQDAQLEDPTIYQLT